MGIFRKVVNMRNLGKMPQHSKLMGPWIHMIHGFMDMFGAHLDGFGLRTKQDKAKCKLHTVTPSHRRLVFSCHQLSSRLQMASWSGALLSLGLGTSSQQVILFNSHMGSLQRGQNHAKTQIHANDCCTCHHFHFHNCKTIRHDKGQCNQGTI